ncbi:MAG: endo-1,4-beta-xylanase, partial [Phycisphaeraceae bacterium]|nr:endo-1,4-beta-xylanase [Phycisphaeraceae bacterium]
PEEGDYRWKILDEWVAWARKSELPIIAGPIVSFEPNHLPDWLFIWEHDYETVRDLIYEHIERVVGHFKDRISTWNVVSGLHINNHFTVAFDQLMDLTRLATMVVKKVQPNAKALVELREPFGEYYGHNQRSIPPMMYADLLIQGSIQFDAFTLKLMMGQAQPGQFVRDLMQISNLLDHFAPMSKPVNLVLCCPSGTVTDEMIQVPENGNPVDPNCGFWRKPWSPGVQGHWFEAVLHIALSKPFVETITWHEIADYPDLEMPMGGLVTEDLQPKASLKSMANFSRQLASDAKPLEHPLLDEAPA